MYMQYCGHNIYQSGGVFIVSESNLTFPTLNDAIAFVDNEENA